MSTRQKIEFDLGALGATVNRSSRMGLKNPFDLYAFRLTQRSSLQLSLSNISKKANLDLELRSVTGTIAKSQKKGNQTEQIGQSGIEAGTYYVRVSRRQGESKYKLQLAATALQGQTSPVISPPVTPPVTPPVRVVPPQSLDTIAPTATLGATSVFTGESSDFTFTVNYTDDVAIDAGSIDSNDIKIVDRRGSIYEVERVSLSNVGSYTVTYRIKPPGGAWNRADSGTYNVLVQPNQVRDSNGNFVAEGTLGQLQAEILNRSNESSNSTNSDNVTTNFVLDVDTSTRSVDKFKFNRSHRKSPTVFSKFEFSQGDIKIATSFDSLLSQKELEDVSYYFRQSGSSWSDSDLIYYARFNSRQQEVNPLDNSPYYSYSFGVVAFGVKVEPALLNQLDLKSSVPFTLLDAALNGGSPQAKITASCFTSNSESFWIPRDMYKQRYIGSSGNDILEGGAGDDLLSGDAGHDLLSGNAGSDDLRGDTGNDVLYGGVGDDNLSGGIENDSLYGDSGNDSLSGNDGNDVLNGGTGNDWLFGGNGDDILNGYGTEVAGGYQVDHLYGGSGKDIFVLGGSWGTSYPDGSGGALTGYSVIEDWNPTEDRIQLAYNSSQYYISIGDFSAGLYIDVGGIKTRIATINAATNEEELRKSFLFV